ncbi:hypothetical protein OQA88_6075 [Cercophora sp. LCS_1]
MAPLPHDRNAPYCLGKQPGETYKQYFSRWRTFNEHREKKLRRETTMARLARLPTPESNGSDSDSDVEMHFGHQLLHAGSLVQPRHFAAIPLSRATQPRQRRRPSSIKTLPPTSSPPTQRRPQTRRNLQARGNRVAKSAGPCLRSSARRFPSMCRFFEIDRNGYPRIVDSPEPETSKG